MFPTSIHELSSNHARLCLSVKKFLEEHLNEKLTGPIVVGCSGGIDSVALAAILHCLDIKIIFAHMDHMLRENSFSDAAYVKSIAETIHVPCVVSQIDIAACTTKYKAGIEETARIERYHFLEQVRKDVGAQWIATGHHLDDLSEDVLLRLIRGTGWPGLAGMNAVDRKRYLLRPLLNTRRSALENFLSQQHIQWVDDPSNQSMAFKRNRVRHTLLPIFEAENPKFVHAIHMLWAMAREDECFWDEMLKNIFSNSQHSSGYFWISREDIIVLPKAARLRVYAKALQILEGHGRSNTFFLLDTSLMQGKGKKCFQFPGGVVARLDPSGITFLVSITKSKK